MASLLQRTLGRVISAAIRDLAALAYRIGVPTLTTMPISVAMLERGRPIGVVTREDLATGLDTHGLVREAPRLLTFERVSAYVAQSPDAR